MRCKEPCRGLVPRSTGRLPARSESPAAGRPDARPGAEKNPGKQRGKAAVGAPFPAFSLSSWASPFPRTGFTADRPDARPGAAPSFSHAFPGAFSSPHPAARRCALPNTCPAMPVPQSQGQASTAAPGRRSVPRSSSRKTRPRRVSDLAAGRTALRRRASRQRRFLPFRNACARNLFRASGTYMASLCGPACMGSSGERAYTAMPCSDSS